MRSDTALARIPGKITRMSSGGPFPGHIWKNANSAANTAMNETDIMLAEEQVCAPFAQSAAAPHECETVVVTSPCGVEVVVVAPAPAVHALVQVVTLNV